MSDIDSTKEGAPPKEFFLASMPLKDLRALAGVSTRQLEERRKANPKAGYQRAHEPERTEKNARYVSYGYPLSSQKSLDPTTNTHFIHPGWLPTAILVNLIAPGEFRRRHGKDFAVTPAMAVSFKEDHGHYSLDYPDPATFSGDEWNNALQPIEVIDGQHRLYAVDHIEDLLGEYEVPVVIFNGLSQALQAYLFWVINVEPKKINPSLAFDLYPELRRQSWLEQGEGVKVYQEHRAQELTEILWRHFESPWRDRIELHGSRVDGHVSNAAFIRSLMASFVRRWRKDDDKIGGLFGSILNSANDGHERVLPWKRTQQAAFLIYVWKKLYEILRHSKAPWAISCRNTNCNKERSNPHNLDLAFAGPYTLLATDQGARAILVILNAMFFVRYAELGLEDWESPFPTDVIDDEDVSQALGDLSQRPRIGEFVEGIAAALFYSEFDWRTSSSPDLDKDPEAKQLQSAFRGSSGYTILQQRALELLEKASMQDVSDAAREVKSRLGW
jgi:DGQHR domain-containing protein